MKTCDEYVPGVWRGFFGEAFEICWPDSTVYIYYDSKLVGPVVYFASAWDARAEQHAYLVHLKKFSKVEKCRKRLI